MRRSRNHACIFQWSIGNEIEWTYTGCREATGSLEPIPTVITSGTSLHTLKKKSEKCGKSSLNKHTTLVVQRKKLAAWTRQMDTTRVVTANCILPSISFETGYIDALDVAGFSYRRVMYDYAKKNYPDNYNGYRKSWSSGTNGRR